MQAAQPPSDGVSESEKLLKGFLSENNGYSALEPLSSALWYLDGRASIINDASKKRGVNVVPPIPERFQFFFRISRF